MTLDFIKYHGAGNDFVIVSDPEDQLKLTQAQIERLCDRRYGIGADGFIRVSKSELADYTMHYYNSDGNRGSMCGNGARCAFDFAATHFFDAETASFDAYDGLHQGRKLRDGWVGITMRDVDNIELRDECSILDTGSPHYVTFVDDIKSIDVVAKGRAIRYSEEFSSEGINVNFVEPRNNTLVLSTYERGVENKTLACGTGATAVALAYAAINNLDSGPLKLQADGGELAVDFNRVNEKFVDIELQGPVCAVYQGQIVI